MMQPSSSLHALDGEISWLLLTSALRIVWWPLTADLKVTGHLWWHHTAAVTSWQASSVSLLSPSIPFLSKPQRHSFSNKFSNNVTELDGIFSLNTSSPLDATTLMQPLFCIFFFFLQNISTEATCSVMGEEYFFWKQREYPCSYWVKDGIKCMGRQASAADSKSSTHRHTLKSSAVVQLCDLIKYLVGPMADLFIHA